MLIAVIVACEVGFWVLLAAGLLLRYALRVPRAGAIVLAAVPAVDVVLLVATVLDLRGGGTASAAHGLAAGYIAFSVVFGHRTIRAIDQRVAHRWAGGPVPVRAPRSGAGAVREAWRSWRRAVTAWVVAVGLLALAIAAIAAPERTGALQEWIVWLTIELGAWLVAGPVSAALVGRRFA